MMNDNILEGLNSQQIGWMKHALGMNRKKKPYRNYFYCSSQNDQWEDLVSKGLASKGQGWNEGSVYYFVTYAAAKALYGKPMSEKYFSEL